MSQLKFKIDLKAIDKITEPARRAQKSIFGTAEAKEKLDKQLKKVNAAKKALEAFKKQSIQAQDSRDKLKGLTGGLKALEHQQKSGIGPQAALTAKIIKQKEGIKKATKINNRYTKELREKSATIKKAGASTKNLAQAERQLNANSKKTIKQLDKLNTRTKKLAALRSKLGKFAKMGAVGGAAAGFLGFKAIKGMVDTASAFEKYQTVLETIEGSSDKAKKSMDWIQDFATTTPYELESVTDAFVKLRAYGLSPTNGLLRTLGDTSSAMGKDINQAVEAMADAVTGENERLKEFGIKGSKKGETITYKYTARDGSAQSKSVANNAKEIEAALSSIFNEKYAGAMKKQSETFAGMISNLSDQWTRFQMLVMNSGVFKEIKSKIKGILDTINELADNGKLKEYAEQFGKKLLSGIKSVWVAFKGFVKFAKTIAPAIKLVADNFTLIASVLIAAKLPAIIATVTTAFNLLKVAMLTNPITAIIAGIAAAAYLIYDNWEGIAGFFTNMWSSIRSTWYTGVADILDSMSGLLSNIPDFLLPKSWEGDNLEGTIAGYREIAKLAEDSKKTEALSAKIDTTATQRIVADTPKPQPTSKVDVNVKIDSQAPATVEKVKTTGISNVNLAVGTYATAGYD